MIRESRLILDNDDDDDLKIHTVQPCDNVDKQRRLSLDDNSQDGFYDGLQYNSWSERKCQSRKLHENYLTIKCQNTQTCSDIGPLSIVVLPKYVKCSVQTCFWTTTLAYVLTVNKHTPCQFKTKRFTYIQKQFIIWKGFQFKTFFQ